MKKIGVVLVALAILTIVLDYFIHCYRPYYGDINSCSILRISGRLAKVILLPLGIVFLIFGWRRQSQAPNRFLTFLKITKILLLLNIIFYAFASLGSSRSYWDPFFSFVLALFFISLILFILILKLKDKVQIIITWIGFIFSVLLILEIVFIVLISSLSVGL